MEEVFASVYSAQMNEEEKSGLDDDGVPDSSLAAVNGDNDREGEEPAYG